MAPKARNWVLLASLLMSVSLGIYAYSIWADRIEYLHWLAFRQVELRNVGWRFGVYMQTHSNFQPRRVDDLVAAGVLAPGEIRFEDPWRSVLVTRKLAPGAHFDGVESTMVLVESYSTVRDGCNVLRGDGHVEFVNSESCNSQGVRDGT